MVNASTKSLTAVANDNPDAIASIFSVNLTDPDTIYPEKTSQCMCSAYCVCLLTPCNGAVRATYDILFLALKYLFTAGMYSLLCDGARYRCGHISQHQPEHHHCSRLIYRIQSGGWNHRHPHGV